MAFSELTVTIRFPSGEKAAKKGVHSILDFDGVVMTDSGAYQILVYGKVDVGPKEIARYQERISTDIATILDIPTSWRATRSEAIATVEETFRRAEQFLEIKSRNDILWMAPIQGGKRHDLVGHSAREMSKLPFQIHAVS